MARVTLCHCREAGNLHKAGRYQLAYRPLEGAGLHSHKKLVSVSFIDPALKEVIAFYKKCSQAIFLHIDRSIDLVSNHIENWPVDPGGIRSRYHVVIPELVNDSPDC